MQRRPHVRFSSSKLTLCFFCWVPKEKNFYYFFLFLLRPNNSCLFHVQKKVSCQSLHRSSILPTRTWEQKKSNKYTHDLHRGVDLKKYWKQEYNMYVCMSVWLCARLCVNGIGKWWKYVIITSSENTQLNTTQHNTTTMEQVQQETQQRQQPSIAATEQQKKEWNANCIELKARYDDDDGIFRVCKSYKYLK